jgi:hypothetical protein
MIFWLVLKPEIRYKHNIVKDFDFLLADFLKIIFLHGENI